MPAKTPKVHTTTTVVADDASHTPWLRRPGTAALLAAALGAGLALGAAWAMLPYANSRARAAVRRSR